MTEKPLICKHCGEENLPHATRCWSCGKPLDEAFSIDGLNDNEQSELNFDLDKSEDLSSFIRDLHEENEHRNQIPKPLDLSKKIADDGKDDQSSDKDGKDGLEPDWLEKIRKRAQMEEDASGDLVKKVSARDQIAKFNDKENIDHEFDNWIEQIRQQARRDDILSNDFQQEEVEGEDEEGIPIWLKRLRETKSNAHDQTEEELKEPEKENGLPKWLKQKAEQENSFAPEQDNSLSIEKQELVQLEDNSLINDEEIQERIETREELAANQGVNEDNSNHIQVNDFKVPINKVDLDNDISFPEVDSEQILPDPYRLIPIEQRHHMELLKGLVSGEGKSSFIQKTPSKPKTKIFRLITSLVLLVMVVIPFVRPDSQLSLSGTMEPFAQSLYDNLSTLQKESQILFVLDYQPAASAEMEILAGPVILQLLENDNNIFPMTTAPEGLWLANSLFSDTEKTDKIFSVEFLPGGRLGMLNFSMQDFTHELSGIIKSYAMSGINRIDDFDGIVVLVDSLQAGRNWLEMVAPYLTDTKIFMISTEQESAMLLPYFDSGQLDGMLTGYYEAGLYASAIGSHISYSNFWKAYQSGLLVMAVLFLVGFIFRLEAGPEAQIKKEKES